MFLFICLFLIQKRFYFYKIKNFYCIVIFIKQFTKEPGRKLEECKLKVVYLPPNPSTSAIAQAKEEPLFSPKSPAITDKGNFSGPEVLFSYFFYFLFVIKTFFYLKNLFRDSCRFQEAMLNLKINPLRWVCFYFFKMYIEFVLAFYQSMMTWHWLNVWHQSQSNTCQTQYNCITTLMAFQVRSLLSKLTDEKNAAIEQSKRIRQEMVRNVVLPFYPFIKTVIH